MFMVKGLQIRDMVEGFSGFRVYHGLFWMSDPPRCLTAKTLRSSRCQVKDLGFMAEGLQL